MKKTNLKDALIYSRRGFKVFPLHYPIFEANEDGNQTVRCSCKKGAECKDIGKHPMTEHGVNDATNDENQIREWWTCDPMANIAIATGEKSGISVFDEDPRNSGGVPTFVNRFGYHETPRVLTGGGGAHYYFMYRDRLPGNVGAGIDIKSDGGYVVAPPSMHTSGRAYGWACDLTTPPAEIPKVILDALPSKSRQAHFTNHVDLLSAFVPPPAHWVEWAINKRLPFHGMVRRTACLDLCCQLRDGGYTREECEDAVKAYCDAVTGLKSHPFEWEQAESILDDILARPRRSPVFVKGTNLTTDVGLAHQFAMEHGEDFAWCPSMKGKGWSAWIGNRWSFEAFSTVLKEAMNFSIWLYKKTAKASEKWENEEDRDTLMKATRRAQSKKAIDAILALAGPLCAVDAEGFDGPATTWLFNVTNGTIDLRTGDLLPNIRGHYITKVSDICHNPIATCPTWLRFLDRMFAGDQELIRYVQQAVGYSLTGNTNLHVLFILHGSGRNGKTTFVETVRAVMGEYSQHATDEVLFGHPDRQTNGVARLKGARFVTATELEEGQKLTPSIVKRLTGGDRITARFLYGEPFEFQPQAKWWIATNYKPKADSYDMALWERIRLIPCEVTIPEEERDRHLSEKLLAELPGILNWAIEGCLDYQKNGLVTPRKVIEASEEYRSQEDSIQSFYDECFDPSEQGTSYNYDTWDVYSEWCRANKAEQKPRAVFFRLLIEKGNFEKGKLGGERYLIGPKLIKGTARLY